MVINRLDFITNNIIFKGSSNTFLIEDLLKVNDFELNNINYYINLFTYNNDLLVFEERLPTYKVDAGFKSINTVNDISLDIEKDFNNLFLENNLDYELTYVFYKNILNTRSDKRCYINEISNDGTELRVVYNDNFNDVIEFYNEFITNFNSRNYEPFYMLGNNPNVFFECINLEIDEESESILIKLSQPVDTDIDILSQVYFTDILSVQNYNVNNNVVEEIIVEPIKTLIPNFNIDINDNQSPESNYVNLNSLFNNNFSSSFSLQNLINSNVKINVNYENFEEFIFFSSLESRINSFYLKVKTLEDINNNLNLSSSSDQLLLQQKTILDNLDDFEQFLYYESGSITYPKQTSIPPYYLQSTGSAESISWYNNMLISGSDYDESNRDILRNFIPNYILEQPNQYAGLFADLIALNFDKIWLYIKNITAKYNNDNRLNYGVSKDLIVDVLKDFGLKIYQNKFSNSDLFTSFLGINNSGSSSYFSNITDVLPASSSLEYIDNLITGSNFTTQQIKLVDINNRIYKRLYNNISYLTKKKGTVDGLRTLINIYGLPSTILRINQFGGRDNIESLDWDHWNDIFNYAFDTNITNSISTEWIVNSDWNSTDNRPENVVFRFKSNLFEPTQSFTNKLWILTDSSSNTAVLELDHQPQYTSSLYNGFPINDDVQYSYLKFYPDYNNQSVSCSVYLPFHNNEWWSVKISKINYTYSLDVYSNHYIGADGTYAGFNESGSIFSTSTLIPSNFSSDFNSDFLVWNSSSQSVWENALTSSFNDQTFDGLYQEIRYYKNLSLLDFINFSVNPFSLENENGIKDELIFRADLGSELQATSSIIGESVHSANSGIWERTASFSSNSNYIFGYSSSYVTNYETIFYQYFNAGNKNIITNKFQSFPTVTPITSSLFNNNLLSNDVLTFDTSIEQDQKNLNIKDINYLEVGFSFQNEVNDDIISELGYFNIGDYIGDPRQRYDKSNSYPDLNQLAKDFFQKYSNEFTINDYSRLIKYIDNSLFKLIKDFIPAKTSISTGHIVKQNLLERNKYSEPEFDNSLIELEVSMSIGNFDITEGGVNIGGEYDTIIFTNYTHSSTTYLNTLKDGVFNLSFQALKSSSSLYRDGFNIYDGIGTSGDVILSVDSGSDSYFFNRKINITSNFITIENNSSPSSSLGFNDIVLIKYQNNLDTVITPLGETSKINDNDESINGEFPGVFTIRVTSPRLDDLHPEIDYKQRLYSGSNLFEENFLSNNTIPDPGYVYLHYKLIGFDEINPTKN